MASDALIGTEIGSYKLTETLGVGGMGAVYLGVHPLIGKRVAVKVLHAEFSDKQDVVMRFFNEARAVSVLRHPNIVELIDFGKVDVPGRTEPLHYCVMELLEGETLRDRIKRSVLPEGEAIHLCAQIIDAVSAAHRQQIIHRDLKPENVFLCGARKDLVKILDFGIAKLSNQGQASVQTQAGVLLGTPSYMSPEQCMGRPVDRRTDVYATGIILFEMVTGRVPFIGEGYADLLIKQISAEVPSPRSINPAISEGLENVIARALAKDPNQRFQSMEEFGAALQSPAQMSGPAPSLAKAPVGDETLVQPYARSTTLSGAAAEMQGSDLTSPPRPVEKPGSSAGLIIALVVLILGGAGGGGFLYLKHKGVDPLQGAGGPSTTGGTTPDPNGGTTVAGTTPPPSTKKAKLHISSDPAGADVKREDGDVLGKTPLDTELPADGSLLRLLVHKEGYKDALRAVVLNERDSTLSFRLVADGSAAPTPPPSAPEPPRAPKPESTKSAHHTPSSNLGGSSHHRSSKKADGLGDDILAPNL